MLIAQPIARNGGDKTYVKFLNSVGLCGFKLWGLDGASHDNKAGHDLSLRTQESSKVPR